MTPRIPLWVKIIGLLALALLYLPMIAVAVFSVNSSRYGMVWRGFTLEWYARLFKNPYIIEAGRNTLILAVASTAVATPLGVLLGLGMTRFPWPRWWMRWLEFIVYLPVVTPDIIFAAALLVALGILSSLSPLFNPGMTAMIVSHVTFQIAFVALVVMGRMAVIGRTVEEAARDLYSNSAGLLRRVLLPLMAPGIIAGAMLAFTLSLDDFVISFFTAGPRSTTLPIYIFSSVRRGVTPEIHALSTLIFVVTIILVVGLELLIRPRKVSK